MFKYLDKKYKIRRKLIAFLGSLHFYGNPSKKLKIIGVTGTNGKTTIASLLYNLFIKLGYRVGLISTVNIVINGNELNMNRKIPTTPDVLTLNKIFRKMIEEQCEYVFMEVSSHAMDQNRVAGIKFTGGIFTNLTHDHLDYHKNLDNYFKAKKKFFKMLPKNAFALVNMDDKYGIKMLEGIRAKKYSYGLKDIKKYFKKSVNKHFCERIESKLIGEFNFSNVLAVYASAILLGEKAKFAFGESPDASSEAFREKVKEIIKELEPAEGRFQNILLNNGAIGIVDYAHSPDALENVLTTLNNIKGKGRVISVFGAGGERDKIKRPIMAQIGYYMSDILILTSDNPRSEEIEDILEDMAKGLKEKKKEKFYRIGDRREAIKKAYEISQKGDYILVAGKGHEKYQEIDGVKYPFSDMEELKKYIN